MRPLYIFDLDGTLALIEHRRHLVEGKCGACHGNAWVQDPNPPPNAKGGCISCEACDGTGKAKPNWPAFFAACQSDRPNTPVINTMRQLLRSRADVQIWSGRSAVVMNETLAWLQRFVFWDDKLDPDKVELVMRREGDFTPDEELKAGWLEAMEQHDRARLVAVFDDRQKVVDMWRSKGVACFQVAPGEF